MDSNSLYLEELLLLLQALQVVYLWLHDWIPLGRLNDVAAMRGQETLPRLVVVTLVQSVPYSIGLFVSARHFGESYPGWLNSWLWVSYGLLFAGEIRAWWAPYLFRVDATRATRYQTMFGNTHSFLPRRNGIASNTLHVLLHFLTAATLLVLFAMRMVLPDAPSASPPQSAATITINAPIERIWHLLVEIDNWPRWNSAVQSAKCEGPLAKGAVFRWNSGITITSTIQTVEPMRHLAWTGKAFGTTATHTWTLERTDNGVVVKTEETFGSWLPWLMHDMMQHSLDEALPQWLGALKVAAERAN